MKAWPLLLAVSLALVGCSKTESPSGAVNSPGDSPKIEVVAFQGGYGIDFYQAAAKEFQEKYKAEVKVDGNPRVWEQLQPRFVSGDVPDLAFPGWGFDHWTAAYEGQLMDLSKALDGTTLDGKGKWRDAFMPSILKLGEYEGKQYMLPYYVSVEGWWYDPAMFAKNGWTPPKTFAELLSLCEKIKAKGIAPLTYQGQYPDYMLEGFLVPWIMSVGGSEALDACQTIKEGAWKSPAVLKAAQMIAELQKKGYFQQGASGMNHTQAQTEFVNGRAAMIPCGSWLNAEMAGKAPKGMTMEFMLVPAADGGKGDATAVGIKIEPWMVPSKAKDPTTAINFFKYMTSVEKAKQFVTEKGTLMAIQGGNDVELPAHLKKAAAAFTGSKAIWSAEYRYWFKDFNKELEGAMSSLLTGELTPEAFCDRVEAAAKIAREDPDIVKR